MIFLEKFQTFFKIATNQIRYHIVKSECGKTLNQIILKAIEHEAFLGTPSTNFRNIEKEKNHRMFFEKLAHSGNFFTTFRIKSFISTLYSTQFTIFFGP